MFSSGVLVLHPANADRMLHLLDFGVEADNQVLVMVNGLKTDNQADLKADKHSH